MITLIYRYVTIIPGKLKTVFGSKLFIIVQVVLNLSANGFLIYSITLFDLNRNEIIIDAVSHNIELSEFSNESSLLFISPDVVRIAIIGMASLLSLLMTIVTLSKCIFQTNSLC